MGRCNCRRAVASFRCAQKCGLLCVKINFYKDFTADRDGSVCCLGNPVSILVGQSPHVWAFQNSATAEKIRRADEFDVVGLN